MLSRKLKKILKNITYFVQAIFIYGIFLVFKILPLDVASGLGAFIMRTLGPLSLKHRIAVANIKLVFPDKDKKEIKRITHKMWGNIGRIIAEFTHIRDFSGKHKNRIKIIGTENVKQAAAMDKGGMFVSAHFGNWELSGDLVSNFDIILNLIYRKPNNFFLNYLFERRTKAYSKNKIIPKDVKTPQAILKAIHKKEFIAMLIDQKATNGLEMDFLGHNVKVFDSVGVFSARTNCPIIPACVKRLKGSNFEATFFPPIIPNSENDKTTEIERITKETIKTIEGWIYENPEQWLWIHDRWKLHKKGLVK